MCDLQNCVNMAFTDQTGVSAKNHEWNFTNSFKDGRSDDPATPEVNTHQLSWGKRVVFISFIPRGCKLNQI